MYKRKRQKYLTDDEIKDLMENMNDEIFADSDSDADEDDNDIDNDISLLNNEEDGVDIQVSKAEEDKNEASTCVDDSKKLKDFYWSSPSENETVKKIIFTSNTGSRRDDNNSSEFDFFKKFISEKIIDILVEQTNIYANQNITDSDKKSHTIKLFPVTHSEMLKFLALTLLMGHIDKDNIKEYWSTDELIDTPIFRKIMSRDRYLHFADNSCMPDKNDSGYDRLWKIRNLLELLNNSYKQEYDPSEELSLDEVIVKFKGRVLFHQYIPKKHKRWV